MKAKIKKAFRRLMRILIGKKGIYGVIGKKNSFKENVIIYENAIIGHNNYFSPYSMINNAQIGNYCSIGPGSKIGLGEHDTKAISTFPTINNGMGEMLLFDTRYPAKVGNDVWIGANVIVKQGVHIGNGAVIGGGAVVTVDIPPYAIAVGVPAKILKYRFNLEMRKKLLQSNWFEKDEKDASILVKDLFKQLY